jgi:hypothetical protein
MRAQRTLAASPSNEFTKEPACREICRQAWGDFPPEYDVHHIDGVDTNNDPNNLIAISRPFHSWLHKNEAVYKALSYRGLFNRQVMEELLKYYKKNRHLYFFIAVMELYRKHKLAKRKIDTKAWVSNDALVREYTLKYGG